MRAEKPAQTQLVENTSWLGAHEITRTMATRLKGGDAKPESAPLDVQVLWRMKMSSGIEKNIRFRKWK
jgi:hypothetical protein